MAANDTRDSNFLFPDMFSFSFDPEILTFLWGLCSSSTGGVKEHKPFLPQSSTLLELFVPNERESGSVFAFVKYSFVTAGVVIIVSATSYFTFKVLQKIRYERHGGVRNIVAKVLTSTKRYISKLRSLKLQISPENNNQAQVEGNKRPSDLKLSSTGSVSPTRTAGNGRGVIIGVPSRNLSVTPVNGEIACGDEDVEDIQSQYFGPDSEDTPKRVSQVISPYSPEFALKTQYESMRSADANKQEAK